jgi:class 3 adenylate cyclase/CHASE2 domain-containing sensor protein
MDENTENKNNTPKNAATLLSIGVIVSLVLGVLSFTHLYEDQESSIYDWRFRMRNDLFGEPYQNPKVSTLDIDDLALQTYGWPLTRDWHARMIETIHQYGARMIGFDIFFYEPSSQLLSVEEIAALEQNTLTKDEVLGLITDYDHELLIASQKSNIVFHAQTFETVSDTISDAIAFSKNNIRELSEMEQGALQLLSSYSVPVPSQDVAENLYQAIDMEVPLPEFIKSSRGVGFALPKPDHDGIVRRYRLGLVYNGRIYFALGLIMACDYLNVPLESVEFIPGQHVVLPNATFPDGSSNTVRIPISGACEMLVNWAGPYHSTFQHMPFNLILDFAELNPSNKALKVAKRVASIAPEALEDPALFLTKMRAEGAPDLPDEALMNIAAQISLSLMMEGFLKESPDQNIETFVQSLGVPVEEVPAYAEAWQSSFSEMALNLRIVDVLNENPELPIKQVGEKLGITRLEDIKYGVGIIRDLLRTGGVKPEHHPLYFEELITSAGLQGSHESDRIITEEDFKDTVFLYGLTATGTHDLNPTPFGPREAMLGAHANVFNTIVTENFLTRIPKWANVLIMVAFGLLIGFLVPRFNAMSGAAIIIALLVIYMAIAFMVFVKAGVWIDALGPIGTLVLGYLSITLYSYVQKEKEKEFVQGAFGHFLDPRVISNIVENPQLLNQLGGDARVMTAFFSDVASFSAISENLTPVELVETINEYLTEMCEVIEEHNGTIDKFEGDAIVAFWGAPIVQEDHAENSVLAAIDMQARMDDLRKKWEDEGTMLELREKWEADGRGTFFSVRMGINTGEMVVGNMGSKTRVDYTMLGDAVNLAARLEGAGKPYGVTTMISESTYLITRALIEARELDSIRVVGKEEPVRVYEVLGKKGEVDAHKLQVVDLFTEGVNKYRERHWDEAISLFEQGLELDPNEGPCAVYIDRCKDFIDNPPPEDWDAVHNLDSK